MQRLTTTPAVQTLGSPLDALLLRSYTPQTNRICEIVRTPPNLLPGRCELIDRIIKKYRYCPPYSDIVYGEVFNNATVPTTGKLYIDCLFLGECRLEAAIGRWDMVDCVIFNAPVMSHQVRSCEKIGLMLGNLIVDCPESEDC